ncbi:MAG TPA: enoyl-CoA hydratase-related protein [Thermoanaerobaculaceae bacterium]|nr:enoyl-CoA hydratase-related protein [Thermoanaerobaculaceae bacterium]
MPRVNTFAHGPIAFVELCRPAAGNALSGALVGELTAAVAAAPAGGARALIVTGAGKHFCAGADLAELAATVDAPEDDRVADAVRLGALYVELLCCPLVTAAAVAGAAFGGGAGLAAACDFVVAGESARFQLSEARLGFVPALISVFLLRRLSPARLGRLVLDPAPIGPDAAREIGLADHVDPDPRATAERLAQEACRKVAPSAVRETKRLLLDLAIPELDRRMAEAARVNARQRASAECRRGLADFLASKSFPDWLG